MRSCTGQRPKSHSSPSNEGSSPTDHGNEVPQEYRANVDRIFSEFLSSICSNLYATDSNGKLIHQTLMANKMQRLDESANFRPFKFRINAFTNAFLEELARQGLPEEMIPAKQASIKHFLWNQPYISRFNQGGKRSKSRGNHIWHIDAKKVECGWTFRPFKRKLAGTPPHAAYVGLPWTWALRIWDPHASHTNLPVSCSSPTLPPWLAWKQGSLTGTPPQGAHNCDVIVEARFMQEGKEELLTEMLHITIISLDTVDCAFTPALRSPLVGYGHNPLRMSSDSIGPGYGTIRGPLDLVPVASAVASESQVVQVLNTAAQRVAMEAQLQVVASPNQVGTKLHALAKQQYVLTTSVQAMSSKMAGELSDAAVAQLKALTAAAQQLVLQAARQVVAGRTLAAVSSGLSSSATVSTVPQITIKEVSIATQSAVAEAVDIVGTLSSEVDVLIMARLLQHRKHPTPLRVDLRGQHSTRRSPRHQSVFQASRQFPPQSHRP
ncbi:hypothetical protein LXA43DRAFT_894961 [Ganoderma leucocontextum]|nr:hypothetical protein LXA43DRAFT_894961 [Ganoderma leucocontextum]